MCAVCRLWTVQPLRHERSGGSRGRERETDTGTERTRDNGGTEGESNRQKRRERQTDTGTERTRDNGGIDRHRDRERMPGKRWKERKTEKATDRHTEGCRHREMERVG